MNYTKFLVIAASIKWKLSSFRNAIKVNDLLQIVKSVFGSVTIVLKYHGDGYKMKVCLDWWHDWAMKSILFQLRKFHTGKYILSNNSTLQK